MYPEYFIFMMETITFYAHYFSFACMFGQGFSRHGFTLLFMRQAAGDACFIPKTQENESVKKFLAQNDVFFFLKQNKWF